MAHVNQLIDHVNTQLRSIYKGGVWVKALVTKLALDERDVLIIEGLDIAKFKKSEIEARIVFRMMPKEQDALIYHFGEHADKLFEEGFIDIPKGSLALYFKVLPAIHWQGEFISLVKDIGLSDEDAKRENLQTGLRIGIENAILSLPDNNMKPWTDADNASLTSYYKESHFTIDALAVALKRTPLAVVDQMMKLGLIVGKEAWKIRNTVSGRYDFHE